MTIVEFDKNGWPKCGAVIDQVPQPGYDLNNLWDTHPDQASVFVDEALIANPPDIYLAFADASDVAVCLWRVGGDTLVVSETLSAIIDHSYRVYDEIGSSEQEADVKETLEQLEKIASALDCAKNYLKKQLEDYAVSGIS